MGVVREYFRKQFQWRMLKLKSDQTADFYWSCWRGESSVLPLLLFRIFLFLVCVAILLASLILTIQTEIGATWPIFMTHWGLVVNTLACGFAVAVSARCYFWGPVDSNFGSYPWYFPTFWVLYNICITVSFMITIFYWAFLSNMDLDLDGDQVLNFAVDPVLDIFIHSVNSVATFLLMMTSAMPARLLHALHPIGFGLVYLLFSLIFYAADGISPFGTNWIYPMLDWAQPGIAMFFVVVVIILMLILYALSIGLTAARDAVARSFRQDKGTLDQYEDFWREERRRRSLEHRQVNGETAVLS